MNTTEMFKELHEIFTGEPGKVHSTIKEYEGLPAGESLDKALDYLAYAERGQANARSDWAYWAYRGDETLARVLISVFKYIEHGFTEFPSLPEVNGKALMDKQAAVIRWAEELEK